MPTHHRTCNLCEANCGILLDVQGGRITAIEGDPDDPLSRGYLCPKAYGLKELHEDPDRLRLPLIRDGRAWRETSWDEAVQFAADGIHRVQAQAGRNAFASFLGNPSAHNLPAVLAGSAFLKALGGRQRFSASSADQFPKMLAAYLVYGAQLAIPVPDVDRTDYLVILGANPLVSNGSLMTAPGMKRRLREVRARGGKVVVVDPRKTETAKAADEHLFIRPGTDAFFLLAIVDTLFTERLVRLGKADGRIDGVEHLRELASGFAPERVAGVTGMLADDIRRIAREFAAAPSAAFYARIGTCVQRYGTLANYVVDTINLLTGRVDAPGGVMFSMAAAPLTSKGHYKKWSSRVRDIPEFGGELPVATLAEEIETPGEGRIRGLFTLAANPVLSVPNGPRLEKALAGLDFMVSVDPALNETTRHAHVILPPRSSLENWNYSVVLLQLAVRDVAKLSPPVFEPAAESLSEWEILGRLTRVLAQMRRQAGVEAPDRAQSLAESYFSATPEGIIGSLIAAGPYDLTFEDLLDNPSGIDLGPLKEGGLERAIKHEDGRIKLDHPEIDAEVARLRGELAERETATDDGREFLLIGRRQLRSNNSWMHNCPSLLKGPERCTLLMHPEDAVRLGLQRGARASVQSRVGEVVLPVEITSDVMPGVVSMPHGFGHSRAGTRMKNAHERPGVSMNDITDDEQTEGMMGNAVLTAVPVAVVRVADEG